MQNYLLNELYGNIMCFIVFLSYIKLCYPSILRLYYTEHQIVTAYKSFVYFVILQIYVKHQETLMNVKTFFNSSFLCIFAPELTIKEYE